MKFRTLLVIVLSLVCGLSAAAGVRVMRNRAVTGVSEVDTKTVLVAAVDIPRGVTIADEHVAAREWPSDMVPSGAFTTMDEIRDCAALALIVKDEPLLLGKLASRDSGRGLAPLIPSGMRAFTIHTPTRASGVAGFVLPGNKVDVLLTVTRSSRDGTGGGSTTTLLQNVEVLAVDQRLDAPAENKVDPNRLRSVTLLVVPDQAAKLSLAQTKGTLHLSLRNDTDTGPADTQPVTMNELRFLEEFANGTVATDGAKTEVKKKNHGPVVQIRTLRGRVSGSVRITQ